MNTKSLLPVIASVFLLAACTEKIVEWKVKTEHHISKFTMEGSVYTGDSSSRTLLYSEDGTLIGNTVPNGVRMEFVTTKAVDTTKTYNSKGELIALDILYKNEKGLVDSVINCAPIVSPMDFSSIGSSHRFIYDADGNKIEVRDYKLGGVLQILETRKFEQGLNVSSVIMLLGSIDTVTMINPVTLEEEVVVQKSFGDTSTYYHSFYPNKQSSDSYVKYLKEHWGDGSVQLKKTRIQVSAKGDTVNVFNYRYTFDNQDRVTSIVSESSNHADYDSTAYTYY